MVQRSHIRHLHLLFFSLVVALTVHLWMLHDPMPAGFAATESTVAGAVQTAPGLADGEHGSGMPFMALTCLAVLLGLGAVPTLAMGMRQRGVMPASVRLVPDGRFVHVLGWRPAMPPPSRVDAGVLLRV